MWLDRSTPPTIRPIEEMIPFLEVALDDKTLITKSGTLVQSVRLKGVDGVTLSPEALELLLANREQWFKELPPDITLSIYHSRSEVKSLKPSADKGNNPILTPLYAKHQSQLSSPYQTHITLVFTKKRKKSLLPTFAVKSTMLDKAQQCLMAEIKEFDRVMQVILKPLHHYQPEFLLHNDSGSSPLLRFWSYIINGGTTLSVPKERYMLDRTLPAIEMKLDIKSRYLVFVDHSPQERVATILSLKTYPDVSSVAMLQTLFEAMVPFTLMQHITMQESLTFQKHIKDQIEGLSGFSGSSWGLFLGAKVEELSQAGEAIETHGLAFGSHVFYLIVYGETKDSLEQHVAILSAILSEWGITTIREGRFLQAAFFAQFPDYETLLSPRKANITSLNLAHFSHFAGSDEGLDACAFGDRPVCYFKKPDRSLYAFTFHADSDVSSAGNTMILGGTGSGKTTFMMFLLIHCLSYESKEGEAFKALLFDSGKGVKIPTLASGGAYVAIGEDTNLGLNPMLLSDTAQNRRFLESFIEQLVGKVDEHDRDIIRHAIGQNFQLAKAHRSLANLATLFGVSEEGSLRHRISKWLPETGDWRSNLFNHPVDHLSFDSQLVGFDMSHIMGEYNRDYAILAPLLHYIFFRFNQQMSSNATPHVIFIDEAVNYLANPLFAPYILREMREIRKRKGLVVLAAQEAGLFTKTEAGQAALTNMTSFVIFPNMHANRSDYIESNLGLTESEYQWVISPKLPKERFHILIKQRNKGGVIIDINLSHLGREFSLLSSSTEDVVRAESIIDKFQGEWVSSYLAESFY